jgi:hypothetical protein
MWKHAFLEMLAGTPGLKEYLDLRHKTHPYSA